MYGMICYLEGEEDGFFGLILDPGTGNGLVSKNYETREEAQKSTSAMLEYQKVRKNEIRSQKSRCNRVSDA